MRWFRGWFVVFVMMLVLVSGALTASTVEASHITTCPTSWPQFGIDCTDPARPYACGTIGGTTGQCRSHAELPGPSTITGQTFNCDTCNWACPPAQPIVCGGGGACSPRQSCVYTTRVTSNECTGACGSCRSGYIPDPSNLTGPCIAPTPAYINFNNPGEFSITDSLRITGTDSGRGDVYLNSGKAIRIDNSTGATNLNIGNWASGTTGAITDDLTSLPIAAPNQPVSLNIFGNLTIRPSASAAATGKLTAKQVCLGTETNCRTDWPVPVGGVGGGLSGGGTANYLSKFTGTGSSLGNSILYETAGNIGIGTTNPGSTLTLRRSTAGTALSIRNIEDSSDMFAINDAGVVTNGSVPWARLTSFPTCPAPGQYIQSLGSTLTCGTPAGAGAGGPGGVSGSGVASKIAFWTGASSLGQNTNLHWDNTNSKLGVGTVTPSEKLEVRDDTSGAARLRISDTGQNPEFQLKYGGDDGNHWAFYVDQATRELRLWRDGNRVTFKENGDMSVSGCLGATVVGATGGTYSGNLNGASAPIDGYRGIDALCNAAFIGSHQCATEEVMTSIHCGAIWTDATKIALRAIIPAGVFAWIANGAPSLPTPTNDCYGWTQTGVVSGLQSQGIAWIFDARGGGGYARPCSEANRILCCK